MMKAGGGRPVMTEPWQALVPGRRHDDVRDAMAAIYGRHDVPTLGVVSGGASGAVGLALRAGDRVHLMRVETSRHEARNPHHYVCMGIAADAGIAPALHFADPKAGIAIMDYVAAVPLDLFPGGSIALARALGGVAARLQQAPAFPVHGDYREIVRAMLEQMERWFEPGLLDRHKEGFERLRRAMPWDCDRQVSSHNDLNPHNVLFDGRRLWLVDWETAGRNDPFADPAVLIESLAAAPDLAEALLHGWIGRPANADERCRIAQMTALTRLYYAGLMMASAGAPPERMRDLDSPSRAEFGALARRLGAATPEARRIRGKMLLAAFLAALDDLESPPRRSRRRR